MGSYLLASGSAIIGKNYFNTRGSCRCFNHKACCINNSFVCKHGCRAHYHHLSYFDDLHFFRKNFLGRKTHYAELSFSQSGEDVIINYVFQCIGITHPSYIDIGAHHPFRLNNTALFYAKGSRGINIEPDPNLFKEFIKHRKQDINLNIGIAEAGDEVNFYMMSAPTMNTFSKKDADDLVARFNYRIEQVQKIKVQTINHIILQYYNGGFPDLLTLDVEGLDETILHSIDYNKTSPAVICVETISFETDGTGVKNKHIIQFLENKGYMVYADTYINTIFVKRDLWIRKK